MVLTFLLLLMLLVHAVLLHSLVSIWIDTTSEPPTIVKLLLLEEDELLPSRPDVCGLFGVILSNIAPSSPPIIEDDPEEMLILP